MVLATSSCHQPSQSRENQKSVQKAAKYHGEAFLKIFLLRKRYQETRDTDVKAGYVSKAELIELNKARDNIQCYVPHHPVINPHKHEMVTKSMQRSSKVSRCSPE